MGHDEVIEAIELAALEPGGLDRLMAGDTAASQAVAGHLAGCPDCTAALAAADRESRIVADVVATTPPADLRARTLALVALRGVRRGEDAVADAVAGPDAHVAAAVAPAPGDTPPPASAAAPAPTPVRAPAPSGHRRRSTLAWVGAIAAAVLLSVGATTIVMTNRHEAELAAQADTIADLRHVTEATVAVAAESDSQSVALAGTQDTSMSGSIVFSPTSTELVVVATGLTEPPAGREFSCWMDAGAGRVRIGKMFFGGGLAYWVGDSPAIAGLDSSATFGVSLVDVGSSPTDQAPVLIGRS